MTSTDNAAGSWQTLAVDRADVDNRTSVTSTPMVESARRWGFSCDANNVTPSDDAGLHCKLNI